jgi:GNAT superfamily N-acetyltransferase
MRVRDRTEDDQPWIEALLVGRWGSTVVVAHGTRFDAAHLPALVAGEREGLATYVVSGTEAEIVTLDAVATKRGAGSALIDALADRLRALDVRLIRVSTTNDNLDALRFYQRRGFRLSALRPGAVDAARTEKPEIPMVGAYGIPLRDEIDLCRELE